MWPNKCILFYSTALQILGTALFLLWASLHVLLSTKEVLPPHLASLKLITLSCCNFIITFVTTSYEPCPHNYALS